MSKVQVRRVEEAIDERFADLIDLSDQKRLNEEKLRDAFLSRGLAALAVTTEHEFSDNDAALTVIDGQDDQGLDAIAVGPRSAQTRITLVQSKWNHQGKAKFTEDDARAMLYGLDLIVSKHFEPFNTRFDEHVQERLEEALDSGMPQITLVLALLRTEPLSAGVAKVLERGIAEYNQVVPDMVNYKIVDLRDAYREIAGFGPTQQINARLRLESLGHEAVPYKAYFGTMEVPGLADLFGTHKGALFAKNIRHALDVSDVNVKIRNTLMETPEHFWYFSNGITILCDRIDPVGILKPGRSAEFDVAGLSVINGAQTVSAIHKAFARDPETVAGGRVLVRLISLENCPPGFGELVTKTTNTQNTIEERDFKSLDGVQAVLREDFALDLSLSYVIRRGEPEPDPNKGCTITEAAEALAATHSNAQFAAYAKRDLAELWKDDAYRELFGSKPSAYRIWRCALLVRAVRERLAERREDLQWRAAAMAAYGDLLITHIVFRCLQTRAIADPDTDWEAELGKVPGLVDDALIWALKAVDREYGPKSQVFAAVRNPERISRIARLAIKGLISDEPAPTLEAEYQVAGAERKGRRANAASTLAKAGRIPDGTVLRFHPISGPEQAEMTEWIEADPKRSLAVWRNSSTKQLQWQVDMQWYSASTLVKKMRRMASGRDQAAQGSRYWSVPGEGTLDELAERVRAEQGLIVEPEEFKMEW